jgi:hypothetical protein
MYQFSKIEVWTQDKEKYMKIVEEGLSQNKNESYYFKNEKFPTIIQGLNPLGKIYAIDLSLGQNLFNKYYLSRALTHSSIHTNNGECYLKLMQSLNLLCHIDPKVGEISSFLTDHLLGKDIETIKGYSKMLIKEVQSDSSLFKKLAPQLLYRIVALTVSKKTFLPYNKALSIAQNSFKSC